MSVFLFGLFFIYDLVFRAAAINNFPDGKIIKIEEGLSLTRIADFLAKEEAIKSPLAFKLTVRLLEGEKNIKAGDYLFNRPYSVYELARKMMAGDYGIEYAKILIKEGDTLESIGATFEEEGIFKKEELFVVSGCCAGRWKLEVRNWKLENDSQLQLPTSNFQFPFLEGFFFPDTYFFPKNIAPQEAVKTILQNFDKKTAEFFSDAENRSNKDFYDILIMASILEKEAYLTKDKKIIAGILWKRLEEKMPLQVDSTLQYITGKNTFELTKYDLKTDSPYNTYKYAGLPPTPISNPGLESIKAAIFFEPNFYWYYLSDKKGKLYYSETFQEHKLKKAEYLN